MSLGLKKLVRGGLHFLRQTVWKEAAHPPRHPNLHRLRWDLRNNHSPNLTGQFCNVSKSNKLPYSQIHSVWKTLSVPLTKDAIRRLFSPLKNGSRHLGSTKSYVPYLAYGFGGLALADHGLTNKSLDDRSGNDLKDLCDSFNNKEQKDKQRKKDPNNYPDDLTGYHFGKLLGRGSYGAIYAAKIAGNQSEIDHAGCPTLSDSETKLASVEIDVTMTERCLKGEMESGEWDFISQVDEMDVDISGSSISSSPDWSLMGSSSSSSSCSFPLSQPPLSTDEPLPETPGDVKTSVEDVRSSRDQLTDGDFNLALKIIFNDRVHSDASAIESAFESEKIILNEKYKLQEHPNIVKAHRSFVDDNILNKFTEAEMLFPRALPRDNSRNGRGRNSLLYLVMHRYEMTLGQYLRSYPCHNEWDAQFMLCQLLEGSAFLCSRNIVHNDLKEDNILVELDSCGMPRLVITDFGCSSVVGGARLQLLCPWYGVSVAGNSALRAPEIKVVLNGRWPLVLELDYRKSDAWAIGTIAYQICGMENPFYQRGMDSRFYRERSLPQLPGFVSADFQLVIRGLLKREPSERFSSDQAANMLHLLLWKPDYWNKGPVTLQKMSYLKGNLYNWLNQIAKSDDATGERSSTVKTELLTTFFSRVKSYNLLKAANKLTIDRWIRWFQAEAARMNVSF